MNVPTNVLYPKSRLRPKFAGITRRDFNWTADFSIHGGNSFSKAIYLFLADIRAVM